MIHIHRMKGALFPTPMVPRMSMACIVATGVWFVGFLAGCHKGPAPDLEIEPLGAEVPSLPPVPTLPPGLRKRRHPDGSFTVYGLRRELDDRIDTEVTVTGRVAEVYTPPPCRGNDPKCKAEVPHLWIDDSAPGAHPDNGAPQIRAKDRLVVVGYAERHSDLRRNRQLPRDLRPGTLVQFKGRFARISSHGFNASNGLLEYLEHTSLPGK